MRREKTRRGREGERYTTRYTNLKSYSGFRRNFSSLRDGLSSPLDRTIAFQPPKLLDRELLRVHLEVSEDHLRPGKARGHAGGTGA